MNSMWLLYARHEPPRNTHAHSKLMEGAGIDAAAVVLSQSPTASSPRTLASMGDRFLTGVSPWRLARCNVRGVVSHLKRTGLGFQNRFRLAKELTVAADIKCSEYMPRSRSLAPDGPMALGGQSKCTRC